MIKQGVVRRWSNYGMDATIVPEAIDPFSDVVAQSSIAQSMLIDPESSRVRQWEAFIMALLIFTAFATPYEVAFLESKVDAPFVFNRVIDMAFVCDMFVNFILPFKNGLETYESSRKKIAMRCKFAMP